MTMYSDQAARFVEWRGGRWMHAAAMVLAVTIWSDQASAAVLGNAPVTTASRTTARCTSPLPVQAMNGQLTDNIPQDFDSFDNPAPTTQVYFTVLLPERCPGDHFPMILQSHGYGGSRITQPASSGQLYPDAASFGSMDKMAAALPYYGYVVISFDERGHGQSQPQNGGGYARLMDPAAETQDARAILDWAYDHADEYFIRTEPNTGIAKDLKVGTIGYSYGGAFQLPLAALDARVDAIVPTATWHSAADSLLPEGAVKQSWLQWLCIFAQTPSAGAQIGTINTPVMASACSVGGIGDPTSFQLRTFDEFTTRLDQPNVQPRPASASELMDLLTPHGMAYFRNQQAAGLPWGFGETQAVLRPVNALIVQGNRDNLFNLTEAYWNYRYFSQAGGDVHLLSMEGGHMNPLAQQVEGTLDCGGLIGIDTILMWLDHHLKGVQSASAAQLPSICLSVTPTPGAPDSGSMGLALRDMPIGSQAGAGAEPAQATQVQATVKATAGEPVFVPITTIQGKGRYLAGVPTIGALTVTAGTNAPHPVVAQIGVGIRRGHRTFLVDDQLTPFVAGSYTENLNVAEGDPVFLAAVGEPLHAGDEVGLLFYEQSVEYSAMISPLGIAGLTGGLEGVIQDKVVPHPLTSLADPALSVISNPNPYSVTASNVQLPIVIPGEYPSSRLIPGQRRAAAAH